MLPWCVPLLSFQLLNQFLQNLAVNIMAPETILIPYFLILLLSVSKTWWMHTFLVLLLLFIYTRGAIKMYTDFKICYLCITFQSCSRTFAQKMVLVKWMLASPCDRQNSHRCELSITILIQFFFSFLKICICFFGILSIYTYLKEDNAKESNFGAADVSYHVPFLGSLYLIKVFMLQ